MTYNLIKWKVVSSYIKRLILLKNIAFSFIYAGTKVGDNKWKCLSFLFYLCWVTYYLFWWHCASVSATVHPSWPGHPLTVPYAVTIWDRTASGLLHTMPSVRGVGPPGLDLSDLGPSKVQGQWFTLRILTLRHSRPPSQSAAPPKGPHYPRGAPSY